MGTHLLQALDCVYTGFVLGALSSGPMERQADKRGLFKIMGHVGSLSQHLLCLLKYLGCPPFGADNLDLIPYLAV